LTAHSFNLPWWVSESLGPAKWVGTDYWNRPLTEEELGRDRVQGLDGVKAYLPAYGQAIVSAEDLQHNIGGEFDKNQAGLWEITVPEWPHPLLPSPVNVPAGQLTVVSTAIVQMYMDLGMEDQIVIHQRWTGKRKNLQGFRDWYQIVWKALRELEAGPVDEKRRPLDPDDGVLWDCLKGLYRRLHGKLRAKGQKVIRRGDWGIAVRDAAWTNMLRKVYKAGGLLRLAETNAFTERPMYPVKMDHDEAVYVVSGSGTVIPDGMKEGFGLGEFRVHTTDDLAAWLSAPAQKGMGEITNG
ncbi:hypothetical protein, partial [Kitasatospora sp. NPDC058402]|uniref:hypothetical protein n=2 Tax=unclassified Kitasatospora TaxID=2633591 RepID=UPI00365A007E